MPISMLESLVVALRAVTVLSSAFNALYFLSSRAMTPRRRIAAVVLALVNLAFLVQGVFGGLLPLLSHSWALVLVSDSRLGLFIGGLPFLASLAMSGLVLRQLRHRRWR